MSFILEAKIAKIKISVPFIELLKNSKYHSKIATVLKPPGIIFSISDSLNLQDDRPCTILFGPHVDESSDEEVPPFYVILNIHNATLHNAMLDSGAYHNLMLRRIMDELGLEVTRPYKYIFSFDSNKVKFLGLIKYLIISLTHICSKTLVMEVVVVDISPNFGMFLSRYWEAKLKCALQMDMSYPTILVFGVQRRIFI